MGWRQTIALCGFEARCEIYWSLITPSTQHSTMSASATIIDHERRWSGMGVGSLLRPHQKDCGSYQLGLVDTG